MPPKRSRPSTIPSKPPPAAPPAKRRSKLAKENDLSAEQEAEIKEAYRLFAIEPSEEHDVNDGGEGVLKSSDIRRCLIALGLKPPTDYLSTLDPDSEGFVPYPHFLAYAAILSHQQHNDENLSEEVQQAYALFTRGGNGPITMAHLKRVARELREEVPEQVLKDMILEANGGGGYSEVQRGVDVKEFEGVMRRAGVFG